MEIPARWSLTWHYSASTPKTSAEKKDTRKTKRYTSSDQMFLLVTVEYRHITVTAHVLESHVGSQLDTHRVNDSPVGSLPYNSW